MIAPKFTGIKYDDDCGWYAVVNGRVAEQPGGGIDGTLESARLALVLAQPAAGGIDSPALPQAWLSIDWHSVHTPISVWGPLEDEERWDNEPGYYESLTPFWY